MGRDDILTGQTFQMPKNCPDPEQQDFFSQLHCQAIKALDLLRPNPHNSMEELNFKCNHLYVGFCSCLFVCFFSPHPQLPFT